MCNYANRTNQKKMRPQAGNSYIRTQLKNGFFVFVYQAVASFWTE